jgi:Icc-related predicted phosphoesterase
MLHAPSVYKADVLIMGGDCTGKMVVAIVEDANGTMRCTWNGVEHLLESEEKVTELEKRIRDSGLYPVRLTAAEVEKLQADPELREELFSEEMLGTLSRWIELAEERLAGSGVRLIMTPGNDDEVTVDPVIASSDYVEAGDGEVLTLGDEFELLSVSWSNPTPWDTPRECSEEELADKIKAVASKISNPENAIYNLHPPPFGSGLDLAPEIESEGKLTRGGAVMTSVGSTAVADAINQDQPLLSLHGHIHESKAIQRLGRTVAINPGSSYGDGSLQGVIVDLLNGKVERYVPVTG